MRMRAPLLAVSLAVLLMGLLAPGAQASAGAQAADGPIPPSAAPDLPLPERAPLEDLRSGSGLGTAAEGVAPGALLAANGLNATPPASITVEPVSGRLAGTRVLPAYAILVFRVTAAEGDSIIFQADAPQGSSEVFDSYLFDAENYTVYAALREGGNPNATVSFFVDYSRAATEHTAFTTEPLPAGTYFVVIDNDERLANGANPSGNVTVTFAVALVNNSLPMAALIVILAGAAAAIYATVRWRPVFDARSPLLAIDGDGTLDDEGAEEPLHPDMDEGEGPPPHPR